MRGATPRAPDHEPLQRICRLILSSLDVPAAALVRHGERRLDVIAEHGVPRALLDRERAAMPAELAASLLEPGEPLLVTDARLRGHLAAGVMAQARVLACAGVALPAFGPFAGALLALDRRPREWTDRDVRALNDLAALAGVELERVRAIEEREQARAALRDSEAQMRMCFEVVDIGMLMVSVAPASAGRIVRVNRAFCEFLGRSEASLIGAHVLDITHPEDRPATERNLAAIVTGERTGIRRVEKRYVHADGGCVWGALTSALSPGTGPRPYVISLVEDVSERQQAQLELPAIAGVLRRILSGEDARQTIVRAALDVAGADGAHLAERAGPDSLVVTASAGTDLVGRVVPLDKPSCTALSYLTGRARFVADAREDPVVSRELLALAPSQSIMWQPIFSHDDVLGVLVVCWRERIDGISTRAARAVALLTDETAVALAHRDALERLRARAATGGADPG